MSGVIEPNKIMPTTAAATTATTTTNATYISADCDKDFVTVVQVEETINKSLKNDDFVTVLQVGSDNSSVATHIAENIVEEVIIYRLPGERLGMALKFEGGTNANEKLTKVFIQSINPDSPASRAQGQQLGHLTEGDEIMQIEGRLAASMTRLECVATLRDAPVCIKIVVKRELICQCMQQTQQLQSNVQTSPSSSWIKKHNEEVVNKTISTINQSGMQGNKKGPPPPVPPRLATTILSSKRKSVNNEIKNENEIEKPPRKKPSQPPPLPPRRPKVPPPQPPASTSQSNNNQISMDCSQTNQEKVFESQEKVDEFIEKVHQSTSSTSEQKTQSKVCETNDLPIKNNSNPILKEKPIEEKNNPVLNNITNLFESSLPMEPSIYLNLLADEDRMVSLHR